MTTLRFISAVIVAAVYSVLTWNKPWTRLKGMFWLWWDSRHVIQAGDEQYKERIKGGCEKCPIFYRPLRTCGSPLADDPSLGCWCQMDIKAKMSSAECWLREHETHRTAFGWRDGL
jgi:hypothetical protein